ncbi:MAG: hypothetical protein ABIJ40_18295 [Bacteroidota bacterium]
MKISQFFEESNGKLSSMRLYCFIALCVAAVLSFTGGSYEFVLTWLVAAFAPKGFQKFSEEKSK